VSQPIDVLPARLDLSVIVFAYNEGENVRPVLEELTAWLDRYEPDSEIIFVDDGSRDDTSDVARRVLAGRRGACLRHEQNRGIGAALKTGVAASSGRWVTFLPADGQIEPQAIASLRAAAGGPEGRDAKTGAREGGLEARQAELARGRADRPAREPNEVDVVFSVYEHRNDGLDRKLLSFGVRGLITLIHGVRLQSDGPYLFRRELFDPQQLKPDTFFLNFEFPIRVLAAGLPHRTVTIRCRPRRAGSSKSTGIKRVAGVARDLFELRVRRLRGE
jgi:glycosyltransferase involved in cell wall biosynthesis